MFDTPEPISATVHIEVGAARITAGDRAETVVEVYPGSDDSKADTRAAELTRVEYAGGRLLVKAPKGPTPLSDPGAVHVEIALPRGSRLDGTAGRGDFTCEGPLGECSLKVTAGDIVLDEAGAVRLRTQHGDITVGRAAGDAEVTTGSGEVRIGEIVGTAEIKSSNGNAWIDDVAGELRLRVANGNVFVGRAHGAVSSKAANGSTRIHEVIRGTVELQTQAGDFEVGIHPGTAAWLDINSRAGSVHTSLGAADGPGECAETVEVRARTVLGDIVIRRAYRS
ncbi:DUF4097 family beta strand repeat-containing protein [Streptomyces sp. P1-3]|uniref:DUF4097 family beta strand repeat-containing protein n=1 Tax=Streptomyces sp. P1-3 TaxID=3421658 RepID=UPI003D35CB3C